MKKFLVLLTVISISISYCFSQDFWERVNVPNDSPVRDIAVSPDGDIFAASIGIYKSSDNAETWTGINQMEYEGFPFDFLGMYILFQSIMLAQDETIFASMLDGVIIKSTDKGQTWIIATEEPQNVKNIIQDEKGILYAFKGLQLYISVDNGIVWTKVLDIAEHQGTFSNYKMAMAPWGDIFVPINGSTVRKKDSSNFQSYSEGLDSTQIRCFAFHNGIVYAGGDKIRGLFSSNDSGKTWNSITTLPDSLTVTALEFTESGAFFAGTDTSGVFVSNDNGLSWTKIEQIPKKEIYSIRAIEDKIYICTNGLYVSFDNGSNWLLKNNGLSYPGVGVYDFNSQNNHYAMTYFNFFRSDDNCSNWYTMDLPFDFRYASFFLIDNEDNMYVASYNRNWFYYSTDYGTTWGDVNDLVQELGITVNNVISLKINSKGYLYLVFDRGESFWKSIDNGHSWQFLKQGNLIDRLYIGNNDELLLYNPIYGSKLSKDDGLTWNDIYITPQINEYEQPHDIKIDDNIIIFAGSETGFHITTDGGSTWENKSDGIATNFENGPEGDIEIFKIQYLNGIVYIATGSGIYFSDNLADTWQPLNSGTVRAKAGDFLYKKDNHLYVASLSGVYRSIDEIVYVEDGLLNVGDNNFHIFPNPANDKINIDVSGNHENKLRITLYDLSGNKLETLFDTCCQNGNLQIPIKHITSGSYFLKLESNSKSKTMVLKVIR